MFLCSLQWMLEDVDKKDLFHMSTANKYGFDGNQVPWYGLFYGF